MSELPKADEIFKRACDPVPDEEIVLPNVADVADSSNPLAVPLAETLHLCRRLRERDRRTTAALRASLQLNYDQHLEIQKLERRLDATRKAATL